MELYRRYAPALRRKCERMLGNREDAEDVVQGLFADMLQKKGRAEVGLGYLYRAATRRCLNRLRDRRLHAELLARQGEQVLAPPRSRIDERVLSLDLLCRLARVLDRRSLEILTYRFLDDMGQEEIAELMALSRKTVGKRLDRIRKAVSELEGSEGGAA